MPLHLACANGNGVIERMKMLINLPKKIPGKCMPTHAYVLQGKGPSLIVGFTFLEDNELLADCVERVLNTKGKDGTVSYFWCQVAKPSI